MSTMAVNVRWAFCTAGFAKALMPLEMASTPVIAVQPLAKERISTHQSSTASGRSRGGATR